MGARGPKRKTTGQRAIEAAVIAGRERGRPRSPIAGTGSVVHAPTVAAAAKAAGVSTASVARAKFVLRNAVPAVVGLLREGRLSLEQAVGVARLPKARQQAIARTLTANAASRPEAAPPPMPPMPPMPLPHAAKPANPTGERAAAVRPEDVIREYVPKTLHETAEAFKAFLRGLEVLGMAKKPPHLTDAKHASYGIQSNDEFAAQSVALPRIEVEWTEWQFPGYHRDKMIYPSPVASRRKAEIHNAGRLVIREQFAAKDSRR